MNESVNPYQAPDGSLLQEDDEVGVINFFSPSSRIGRLRMLTHTLVIYLGFGIIAAIVGGALATSGMVLLGFLIAVMYIGLIVILWIIMIQRLHDLNRSGWYSLLSFVPLVNIALSLILLFAPGTDGKNKFGPRPPKNQWYHWVGGLIFPIAFIGVIAAVSIPAYQDYTERAKAAQLYSE